MLLAFSETKSDYGRYLYPYVVWALPEAGETPADFFRRGFLPASPLLDRFYLCRNIRVDLARFKPSSENRRILRKGQGIEVALTPRSEFDYSPARREHWKRYADERFGNDIMSFDRLDRLMSSPVISHLLCFREQATGRELGTALMYIQAPDVAYYYYAFYDLELLKENLGMYMMTRCVAHFAERGFAHVHLGTCYSRRALYKAQFAGVEFMNGYTWSSNVDELKFLVRREEEGNTTVHLFDNPDYLAGFLHGDRAHLAGSGGHFRLAPGATGACEPRPLV